MSDFLDRIAARAKGEGGTARPRLPARFERADVAPRDAEDPGTAAAVTGLPAGREPGRVTGDRGERPRANDERTALPPPKEVPAVVVAEPRTVDDGRSQAPSGRPVHEQGTALRAAEPAVPVERSGAREAAGPGRAAAHSRASAPVAHDRDQVSPPSRDRPTQSPTPSTVARARPVRAAPVVAAMSAPPAPVVAGRTPDEQPVVVHIGRVEVRAGLVETTPPRAHVDAAPGKTHEGPSLSEYLRGKRAPR
ncbi:MAG TPA: hypothetical protein VIG64_14300 [Actinomycetota bacterium]